MISEYDIFKNNSVILLVSDSPSLINLLTIMLRGNGYHVTSASGAESAIKSAIDDPPDLVLMKILMSETDGYNVCRIFKDKESLKNIPIILICYDESTLDKDMIFSSGGIDYLTKPLNINEVLARIETHLKLRFMELNNYDLKKMNNHLEKKVYDQQKQMDEAKHTLNNFNFQMEQEINALSKNEEKLREAKIEAERAASIDYLTGLLNRRAFTERFSREFSRIKRTGGALGIIITDIDYFKNINDTYSHHVGDLVLREFSKCLTAASRPYDFISRHGGEEFLICLPDATYDGVYSSAERMRCEIEKIEIRIDGIQDVIRTTASFGFSVYEPDSEDTLVTLIQKADKALYRAKAEGRNKVCCPDDAGIEVSSKK